LIEHAIDPVQANLFYELFAVSLVRLVDVFEAGFPPSEDG